MKQKSIKSKELKLEFRNINWIDLRNYLIFGLIIALISVFLTHQYDKENIEYQQELSYKQKVIVGLLEPTRFQAQPNKIYPYNLVVLTNPTDKKITIHHVTMYHQPEWEEKEEGKLVNITIQKQDIEKPQTFPPLSEGKIENANEFKPFMELEPGDSKVISAVWLIKTPRREDNYTFNICATTFTEEEYCANDKLLIEVTKSAPS